jgi:hypothetical protein
VVEHRDVGLELVDELERTAPVGRLADEGHARLARDRRADAVPEQRVIVRDDHAQDRDVRSRGAVERQGVGRCRRGGNGHGVMVTPRAGGRHASHDGSGAAACPPVDGPSIGPTRSPGEHAPGRCPGPAPSRRLPPMPDAS